MGNITVGGAGKTPSAVFLGKLLIEKDYKICYLSKGYGRKSKHFVKVNPDIHDQNEVGDEPLLLANAADTYVYDNINQLGDFNASIAKNYDFIIIDDGIHNNAIYKDIKILVRNAKLGYGNGFIFPSGPLRCLPNDITADVNFIIHERQCKINNLDVNLYCRLILPSTTNVAECIAFAGIAVNQKFFDSLRTNNIKIVKHFEFPDHHNYCEKDMQEILILAKALNMPILTTEKDYVKVKKLNIGNKIQCVKLELTFCNPEDVSLLQDAIQF